MTSRVLELSQQPNLKGRCVIYVMSRDQRVQDNHALLEAQKEALECKLPLVVLFNVLPSTGYRRREHYEFMVKGLKAVEQDLAKLNIPFVLTIGDISENVQHIADELDPRSVYFDFSPLRGPRTNQKTVAKNSSHRVAVVDTHNIVPAWVTSDKEEFAAHTIRRKLHKLIADWAVEPETLKNHPYQLTKTTAGANWPEVDELVQSIPPCGISHEFISGESAAIKQLERFIETGLDTYASQRNDANQSSQSDLSPYLHFGQISSLRILLTILNSSDHPPQLFTSFKMPIYDGTPTSNNSIDSFVEELIVRKELSDNYCFYNADYDNVNGVKDWAKKTLADHAGDPREFVFTKEQLRTAQTHDDLWNAAQNQLIRSGKIHGYMRMYWAKKILEWTDDPSVAIDIANELNDTYHLDGGDPNGYVGVLWGIAGLHDRPWFNRSIFGTVRYMARSGADKKFDTAAYIQRWS